MIKGSINREISNTFLVPEIIFNPSLILSLHIFFLGLIFDNNTFVALNLTSAGQFSKLDIQPGTNQLPLLLKLSIANIPVFYILITTAYNIEISETKPLPYITLLPLCKILGLLAGFPQIHYPYSLWYSVGNIFNQSGSSSILLIFIS